MKLSISHALSQSTKLCVFEERVLEIVQTTKDLPEALATTGLGASNPALAALSVLALMELNICIALLLRQYKIKFYTSMWICTACLPGECISGCCLPKLWLRLDLDPFQAK